MNWLEESKKCLVDKYIWRIRFKANSIRDKIKARELTKKELCFLITAKPEFFEIQSNINNYHIFYSSFNNIISVREWIRRNLKYEYYLINIIVDDNEIFHMEWFEPFDRYNPY